MTGAQLFARHVAALMPRLFDAIARDLWATYGIDLRAELGLPRPGRGGQHHRGRGRRDRLHVVRGGR